MLRANKPATSTRHEDIIIWHTLNTPNTTSTKAKSKRREQEGTNERAKLSKRIKQPKNTTEWHKVPQSLEAHNSISVLASHDAYTQKEGHKDTISGKRREDQPSKSLHVYVYNPSSRLSRLYRIDPNRNRYLLSMDIESTFIARWI
ncbi:hypothetical protein P691DRAFT_774507 [Macrolepiota fuliginosa MF-IS2]|uniref:Uncharacterized protein n=1 Tax=Macrolepiota fuliginosa MF-IS2 TaxID=1400762 RepID=A0A9P5XET3_9AGAR|nr:hypothetical protein P691DRAFT_774507 [Macrolepiota fuliginosa MF-IS2]